MEISITKEDMKSYAEVNYIINHMNERYFEKIPQKIKDFLYIVKDDSYETTLKIDPATPLTKQGISKYALEVIAIFHLKYWCENEEMKRNLLNRIEENHRKFEEQLRVKYSPDVFSDGPNNQVTSSSSNIYQGFQDFENNVSNVNAKSIQEIKANKETNYDEIEKAAELAESQKEFEQTVQDVNTSSAKNVQKAAEELTELSKKSSFKNFVLNIIKTIKDMFKKKEVALTEPAQAAVTVETQKETVEVVQEASANTEEVKVEPIKEEVSSK